MKPDQRGFCFVRQNVGGEMVLTTYGKSSGFCIDPIEKKPLNHFLPGTPVFSFGTAGCNLGCKFCQNWDISKAREIEKLSAEASPERIAQVAHQLGCSSVAFTYNDPVIFLEYAVDVARACHEIGLKTVAVTAGYIMPEARVEFFDHMDAANVDLKAFTEAFYLKRCVGHLEPVLDTLKYLKRQGKTWFEITNLIIPSNNDEEKELAEMCDWIMAELGPDVPLHFTAFHPDYKMRELPNTPAQTLMLARDIAMSKGLHYVYTGNIHDHATQSTYCPNCKAMLIQRDWHQLGDYHVRDGACTYCKTPISGLFSNTPGTWGARRLPVNL